MSISIQKKGGKLNKVTANFESAIQNFNIDSKHTWLSPDNITTYRSDDYFKDISYIIDLQHIYKLVDTCTYHCDMPLIPVLLQIQPSRVKQAFDGASYLMQIWRRDTKERCFQIPLNSTIKYWNVTFNELVYILEQDSINQIHLLRFGNDDSEQSFKQSVIIGIPNPTHIRHICIYNQFLIIATKSNELKIYDIEDKLESSSIDLTEVKYKDSYQCDLNIMAFLIELTDGLIIVFETLYNKLDFNKLKLQDVREVYAEKRIFMAFEQLRDIYPREPGYFSDPIQKVVFRYHHKYFKSERESILYAVALKQSGRIDLYSNMLHKQHVLDVQFRDVSMSLSHFYFRTIADQYLNLKHIETNVLSYEQSELIMDKDFNMHAVTHKIVERYARFFQSYQLLMHEDLTYCLVAHQNFVSVFDIINWKWINHIQFEKRVSALFFQKDDSNYISSVLIGNKFIFFDITKYFTTQEKITNDKKDLELPKACNKFVETNDNSNQVGEVYFLAYSNTNSCVYVVQNKAVHTVNGVFEGSQEVLLLQLQYQNQDPEYYDVRFFGIDGGEWNIYTLTRDRQEFIFKKEATPICYDYSYYSKAGSGHSAVKSVGDKYLFFDRHNCYIVDSKNRSFETITGIECQGLLIFNKYVNYGTFFESATQNISGLKMIDIKELVNKQTVKMTLLKQTDIGGSGQVYFDNDISRICFQESQRNIIVHPYLHMNYNKFINMKNPKDYICFRQLNHQLIAFKKKGELTTWDVLTGKFLKSVKLHENKFLDFQVYSNYKDEYSTEDICLPERVLLMSNTDIADCRDADYFTADQLATQHRDQVPLIEATEHTYRQFFLLEILSPEHIEIKMDFIFPKFKVQMMFINDSCDRMVVMLANQRVFLYKAKGFKSSGYASVKSQPQWELLRQITDFPYFLDNKKTETLEPFTKDFALYIRYGKKAKAFQIKHTDTGELLKQIPTDVMNYGIEEDPLVIINRFKWIDHERFLITNPDGVEKIVNIRKDFEEEVFNQRPLFNDLSGKEWLEYPYYCKRSDPDKDVLLRLKRVYQNYKSMLHLFRYNDPDQFYRDLLVVEPNNIQYFEHSFTFLHWSIMDQLNRKLIKVKDLRKGTLEFMVYNILPGGNTLMHKIYNSQEKMMKVFRICHENDAIDIHMPVLLNMNRNSSFDLSLSLGQKDYRSIFSVLKYLQLYPADHHSRTLKSSYSVMIEQELPEFLDYLDTRFQQTEQMKEFDEGQIEKETTTTSLWLEEKKVKTEILSPIKSEAKIKIELLDMPDIYHFRDEKFTDVFRELAGLENYNFFENKAIRVLIDFNFPIVRGFLLALLIIPFVIFHIIYVVYMNVVYEHRTEEEFKEVNYILAIIQLVFSAYFLFNEARQIINLGLQYLTSVWNYIDLLAPSFVIIVQGIQFAEYYDKEFSVDTVRTILAFSTFLMWIKFLSVFRIFKSTSYLIRMITEVIRDMGIFLFILLITVAAFGDTFLRISLGNEEEDRFIDSFVPAVLYAYSMILGGYDTEAFGIVAYQLVFFFWVLCTLLDMIVMLNLLIAIISSTFDKVNSNADQASYQEMAALISENHYLLPKRLVEKYAEQNKYILVAEDMEKQGKFKDPLEEQFKSLQSQIDQLREIVVTNNTTQQANYQSAIDLAKDNSAKLNEKMGEVKLMMASQLKKETVTTFVHKNPLQKYMLYNLQEEKNFQNYTAWYCDAKNFKGCLSGYTYSTQSDPEEILFHCKTCNFDFCAKCNEGYQNVHQHPLEAMTHAQLAQRQPEYTTGWMCDGRNRTACSTPDQSREDIYEYIFHDDLLGYDLCQACVRRFKQT